VLLRRVIDGGRGPIGSIVCPYRRRARPIVVDGEGIGEWNVLAESASVVRWWAGRWRRIYGTGARECEDRNKEK